jgi:hypothetical protein
MEPRGPAFDQPDDKLRDTQLKFEDDGFREGFKPMLRVNSFRAGNSFVCEGFCPLEVQPMSKETPETDPRQRTDQGSHKQTDKPWKGNPEKEQRNEDVKPDLEKWQESSTH